LRENFHKNFAFSRMWRRIFLFPRQFLQKLCVFANVLVKIFVLAKIYAKTKV
jgi:hypothetical protein